MTDGISAGQWKYLCKIAGMVFFVAAKFQPMGFGTSTGEDQMKADRAGIWQRVTWRNLLNKLLRDFTPPPRCRRGRCSSGILRSVVW